MGAPAGAVPALPVPAALQPPGLPGPPAPVQSWAAHRPVSSAPPCSSIHSTSSSCSGAWKRSSWPPPEPLRLLLGGSPLDQPLTWLGPQTLRPLTQPTVPPAPPLHPSASWVASAANRGTLAGWPMGCLGAEVQPCLALPMKVAPALLWGGFQMHLGAIWLALSPQGPGHGAGWTHSQTENPHESPHLGAPAAHLDPQCLGPGMPCIRSAQGLSQIPGCDGPAQLPPDPTTSPSFSFVALTPLHQGTPLPLHLSGTRPHGTRPRRTTWHNGTSCTFRLGDQCCYLITNIIECLRGRWASPVRTFLRSCGPAEPDSKVLFQPLVSASWGLILGAITPFQGPCYVLRFWSWLLGAKPGSSFLGL